MKKLQGLFTVLACVGALALSAGCTRSHATEVYRNAQFGIEMTVPSILHQVDLSTLGITAKYTPDDFGMMAAREGGQPYGMVMIAQRLHSGQGQIRDASDYMRRVEAGRVRDVLMGRGVSTNASGLEMDHLDWKDQTGQFNSAVITTVGDFLIVVRCNAKSEAELKSMVDAFTAMRRTSSTK